MSLLKKSDYLEGSPPEKVGEDESSSSEDGLGSPYSPTASDFTIKVNTPKKPSKRPSEPTQSDGIDLLSRKRNRAGEEDVKKLKPVGRVCTEEDEIRILNGMIQYEKETGADPSANMGAFHEFVRGNLESEITKTQLYEKIRRLRIKYFKNAERIEKGENVDFSKPHDKLTFSLSKNIWGGGDVTDNDEVDDFDEKGNASSNSNDLILEKNGKEASPEEKHKKKKTEEENVVLMKEVKEDGDGHGGDFEEKYPFTVQAYTRLGMGGIMTADEVKLLKSNLSVVGTATSEEFEGKWKEMQVKETEILLKKFQVFIDHTRLVLNAMKK